MGINKVLFVSQYSSSNPIGGNNNVFRQAKAINNTGKYIVEILTTIEGDSGQIEEVDSQDKFYFEKSINGIKYHFINTKYFFTNRVLSNEKWNKAINVGVEILDIIKPDFVHLQHWRALWWILESAQKNNIPTIYSPHDWGLGCLRTILVNSDGDICDGKVAKEKCRTCVSKRTSFKGNFNESTLKLPLIQSLVSLLTNNIYLNQFIVEYQIETINSEERVRLHLDRINRIISKLSGMIVPNFFAKNFFLQFGISQEKIHVEPWYYDRPICEFSKINTDSNLNIGYIGRISPEKGLKRIFQALELDIISKPIHFVIAGDYSSPYAYEIYNKYKYKVGIHTVEWLGWVSHHDLINYYKKIDVNILISEWIENGPLTLCESFSFNCPVIITDTPNVENFVFDGVNSFKVKFGSTDAIAEKIQYIIEDKSILDKLKENIIPFKSSIEYANAVNSIYRKISV